MDLILKTLFNGGVNNGDLILECKDGEIKCHSGILGTVSKVFLDMISESNTEIPKRLKIDYTIKPMKFLLAIVYNSTAETYSNFHDTFVRETVATHLPEIKKKHVSLMDFKEYLEAKKFFQLPGPDVFPLEVVQGMTAATTINIVLNLQRIDMHQPLRQQMYQVIYDRYLFAAPGVDAFARFYEDPLLCKDLVDLYKRKLLQQAKDHALCPKNPGHNLKRKFEQISEVPPKQ